MYIDYVDFKAYLHNMSLGAKLAKYIVTYYK